LRWRFIVLRSCAPWTLNTGAVIPKGSTHEHWKTVHAGAVKAQRELKDPLHPSLEKYLK